MKKISSLAITIILSLSLFAQERGMQREFERYLVQELESHQAYQIPNIKDRAAFFGFFIEKGELQNASVSRIVQDTLVTDPFSLWNSKKFLPLLHSFMLDSIDSRWVIVPILFLNTGTEESSKTVLISQQAYRYMLTGLSLVSTKLSAAIFSKPIVVYFSDPYID